MGESNSTLKQVSDRALEMIMRDVLDGVMELSLESAYKNASPSFEIVDITTVHRTLHAAQKKEPPVDAEIIDFPMLKQVHG